MSERFHNPRDRIHRTLSSVIFRTFNRQKLRSIYIIPSPKASMVHKQFPKQVILTSYYKGNQQIRKTKTHSSTPLDRHYGKVYWSRDLTLT